MFHGCKETELHALILSCFELKDDSQRIEENFVALFWAVSCLSHVWEVLGSNVGTKNGNPDGCL